MAPHIAFLSEQYVPDLGSSAQLFGELAHELARNGMAVQVRTLQPGYVQNAPRAAWHEHNGNIEVRRLPRLPFARTNRKGEALNWIWATVGLTLLALRLPRRVPLLIGTNPPMLHLVGALMKVLKGQRFIALFYDLHPELSCAVGVLRPGSLLDRIWRRLNQWILRHADIALSLGPYMEHTIKTRNAAAPTMIIHNWCDAKTVRCMRKAESRFATEHGLQDNFVVLFSGNMGWRQRLEILLEVAARVQDTPIRFVFIGEGAKKAKLQEAAQQRGLQNVLFFPYQPRDLMAHSLAAADISVVSQEREVIGFGVPSKIYTYMASGRPMLGLAGQPCEVIDMINEYQCGWTFDEDHDAEAIAAKLRELCQNREQGLAAGQRARLAFERHFSLEVIARQYADLIQAHCELGPAPSWFERVFLRKREAQSHIDLAAVKRKSLELKLVTPPKLAYENSPLEGDQGGAGFILKKEENVRLQESEA